MYVQSTFRKYLYGMRSWEREGKGRVKLKVKRRKEEKASWIDEIYVTKV